MSIKGNQYADGSHKKLSWHRLRILRWCAINNTCTKLDSAASGSYSVFYFSWSFGINAGQRVCESFDNSISHFMLHSNCAVTFDFPLQQLLWFQVSWAKGTKLQWLWNRSGHKRLYHCVHMRSAIWRGMQRINSLCARARVQVQWVQRSY